MTDMQPRSPFSRPWFIASAGVIGVIVLAAIVVLVTSIVTGGTDDTTASQTPSTSESTSPGASAKPTEDPAGASACGLDGFETESSLDAAPANEWELVGTVAAPFDPEGSGPGLTDDDGFRSCFAHTAEGALFAASNMLAMGSDARLQPLLAERAAVPGPGRDAAMEAEPSTTQLRYQISGYKVTYRTDEATVDLAVSGSGGELVSVPFLLQWSEGDWKTVLTDDGQQALPSAPLQNLGGYTPWAGA
jgi:hypothetical protein